MIPEAFRRAAILAFLAFIVTAWLAINYSFEAGMIYTVFVGVSAVFYLSAKTLKLDKVLVGVGPKIGEDIFLGVGCGLGFIIVNILTGMSIGVSGYWVTAAIAAPLGEELVFRGMILALADSVLPFSIAAAIVSILFAAFHYMAYGAHMSGAYLGAAIFSMVACIFVRYRKSLVPVIIMHSIFNMWILAKMVMVGT